MKTRRIIVHTFLVGALLLVAPAFADDTEGEAFRADVLRLVDEARALLLDLPADPSVLADLDALERRLRDTPQHEFDALSPRLSRHARRMIGVTERLRGEVNPRAARQEDADPSVFPAAKYPEIGWLFAIESITELPEAGPLAAKFDAVCNKTAAPGPNSQFLLLNEIVIAEAARDIARWICTIPTGGELACMFTDVAFLINRALIDNQFLCGDLMAKAEITGTYLRLGYFHTELGDADTDIGDRIDLLELNMLREILENHGIVVSIDAELVLHDELMVWKTDTILAAIAALTRYLEEFRAEDIRMEIETALADADNKPEAVFLYPEAEGGRLELVRAIVANAIADMESAGQGSGNAAQQFVVAEAHMRAGDWTRAYEQFGKAYRTAVK